jgi:DNA repair protein RadC
VPGIRPAMAARFVASCALTGRILGPRDGAVIFSSSDIAGVAMSRIGSARAEQVAVIVADGGSRMTGVEVVASGSAKSCPMPVREVLAAVLRHDGVAFGVAHNHPGGDATPTQADVRSTDALGAGAEVTGLRFLDHVVVTATDWRSITMSRRPSAP